MITLAKSKIENVTVEMTVEEKIGSRMGGYPMIHFGDVQIESAMVQEVDTLTFIKSIITSETVDEFSDKISECWGADNIVIMLKAYALECSPRFDDGMIVENSFYNGKVLNLIRHYDDIVCAEESTPWERTKASAKIYDLKRKLHFVPMSDELKEALGVDLDE